MHFEILVEDYSGKRALDIIVPKIISDPHPFRVHPYKGIGRIPKGLKGKSDPQKRILLDQLPRLLRGYGRTFSNWSESAAVFVVADLDDKCLKKFRGELLQVLNGCRPKPKARFCIAIEEGEAWLLGDIDAVKAGYRSAKSDVLNTYLNDSVCGTWEKLADAVYPGGFQSLSKQGWYTIGVEKTKWAESIAPEMDVDKNKSPSFCYFRDKLRELAAKA